MEQQTWDGQPVSPEPPFGAMIVVWRLVDGQRQFLVTHRGQFGPDWEDGWA